MPKKEILDIEIADRPEVEESASTRLNILSWLYHHASQIAKGGAALVGLALLGGVGYLARGGFSGGRKATVATPELEKAADGRSLAVRE